jgi:hypothetical protein
LVERKILKLEPKHGENDNCFKSGANVSTLSRQILRVSTSENTPSNLRSQTSSLSAILSAKVRCKKECFGSQVCLYQDLNVNPDHDSTTTIEAVVKCVLVQYTTKSQSNQLLKQ